MCFPPARHRENKAACCLSLCPMNIHELRPVPFIAAPQLGFSLSLSVSICLCLSLYTYIYMPCSRYLSFSRLMADRKAFVMSWRMRQSVVRLLSLLCVICLSSRAGVAELRHTPSDSRPVELQLLMVTAGTEAGRPAHRSKLVEIDAAVNKRLHRFTRNHSLKRRLPAL